MTAQLPHAHSFEVTIAIEPDGDGFYGYCPGIKGIHVHADTIDETVDAAKDAVCAYLEMSLANGDPLPVGFVEPQHAMRPVPSIARLLLFWLYVLLRRLFMEPTVETRAAHVERCQLAVP